MSRSPLNGGQRAIAASDDAPQTRPRGVLVRLSLPAILFAALLAGASYAASPVHSATTTSSEVVSQKNLKVWAMEGDGNAALAHYRPHHPPGYYDIGTTPSAAQIAAWSIGIPPSGAGLPPGQGSVAEGGQIFQNTCAACHGSFGEGANGFPQLVGGVGSLGTASPQKTVGSYLPYATTLWDYIDRAMPFPTPHTLKPDQVYALVAWILNANGIVPDNWIADAKTVPLVKMPAVGHWNWQDPRPVTHNVACMENCANPEAIRITSTAVGKHLTPPLTGPLGGSKGNK